MPTLIRLEDGAFREVADAWTLLADEAPQPAVEGGLLVSTARMNASEDFGARPLGVRLTVDDAVEAVAPHLNRLSLIALEFPKFRDGRALSTAALLRERYGFSGELRAVGEVLRDQAFHMARCGFNAFVPADNSDAATWAAAVHRHRHVYQTAQDHRTPAYLERAS